MSGTNVARSRTIIIGVDGSERDDDAIALGGLLAQTTDARALVASVCMYPALSEPDDAFARVLLQEARTVASHAAQRVRGCSAEPRAFASYSAAHGLQQLAKEEDADLVVVGSSRRGGIGRIVAGSTPERLMHDAPCGIAIAPLGYADGSARTLASIGVGFDGGDESRVALDAAAQLARATGAKLTVIGVVGILVGPLVQSPAVGVAYAGELDLLREREERIAREAVASVDDVEIAIETPAGDAGIALVKRSSELDLLFVGSHAYGSLRRFFSGSVSTRLARSTACPLVILPRGVPSLAHGAGMVTATATAEEG